MKPIELDHYSIPLSHGQADSFPVHVPIPLQHPDKVDINGTRFPGVCIAGHIAAWSNKHYAPPMRGTLINITCNSIGIARITGYFIESGYLGIIAVPLDPPEWFIKQNGPGSICHVFGAELDNQIPDPAPFIQ